MDQAERDRKITEVEAFVNERLKVDLQHVLMKRDEIFKELSEYLELKNTILLMKENKLKSLDTMVNLGSQVYCQAKVDDTSKIFVKVGLGFHVEFTFDEAIQFIDTMEVHLTSSKSKSDILTFEANNIRERIRVIYDTLQQLLNLPPVEEADKKKPKNLF